jgi:asparagine synthase (glutamine-hydrolysing)
MLAADVELLVGQELDNCQADDQMNRLLRQDMRFYMEGGILTKVDRASMSVSLETRVPFLNKIVLDYLESTPVSLKLRGFKRKWLLRQAMKDLLPKNILDRKKKGFSMPVAKWLAEDLHDLARAYLSPERIGKDGLFNPNYVTALLDDHTKRRRNHHKLLWTLLMFQLWKDEWLDNRQSVSHL